MPTTTVPARVSLITLGVSDLDRSIAFYEALGWRQASSSVEGDVAFFPTADSAIALFGLDDLAEDAGLDRGAAAPASLPLRVALAINVETEEALQQVLDTAQAAGTTILRPARQTVFGANAYFLDPDGHAWEIAYNPGFAIGPDGRVTIP